jgi:hypothetical protein
MKDENESSDGWAFRCALEIQHEITAVVESLSDCYLHVGDVSCSRQL